MIVVSLALEERHGEASKQLKMPHQYSGKFFAKTENQSQNHQNLNLHHLYIAEILTKLQVIYDAMVWKVITTRFRNWIASIYIGLAEKGRKAEIGGRSSRRQTANCARDWCKIAQKPCMSRGKCTEKRSNRAQHQKSLNYHLRENSQKIIGG